MVACVNSYIPDDPPLFLYTLWNRKIPYWDTEAERDCFRERMVIDIVLFPCKAYDVHVCCEQRALQFIVVVDVSVF